MPYIMAPNIYMASGGQYGVLPNGQYYFQPVGQQLNSPPSINMSQYSNNSLNNNGPINSNILVNGDDNQEMINKFNLMNQDQNQDIIKMPQSYSQNNNGSSGSQQP